MRTSRRTLISTTVATLALSALSTLSVQAQGLPKLKVGLMLPYTGTYAALGNAIENGFRLHVAEQGLSLIHI